MSLYNHLPAPVILVTRGRGREVFGDSGKLFDRLAEIPELADEITSVQTAGAVPQAVKEAGVRALNFCLRNSGLRRFSVALRRRTGIERRPRTRWAWRYFCDEFLGLEWKSL